MVPLKEVLKTRRRTVGSWITFPAEAPAEIMARAGFDWLVIDMEHAPIGIGDAARLIRIIDLAGLPALCRLPSNDPVLAKGVLEAGAAGIIVPAIESADEARRAVDAVYYPPRGRRGVGLSRAQEYGRGLDAYRRRLEADTVVIAMVETAEGVRNAAEIGRTPGIDAIIVGPYDLSASLGHIGELDHPEVRKAESNIRAAADAAGIGFGLHVVHPTEATVRAAIDIGYTFLAIGVDMILLSTAAEAALRLGMSAAAATGR